MDNGHNGNVEGFEFGTLASRFIMLFFLWWLLKQNEKAKAYASFGIWTGLLVGLTVAAILLYIRFNYLTKRLIKEKLLDNNV